MMLMTTRACAVCPTNYLMKSGATALLQIRGSFSQTWPIKRNCRAGARPPNDFVLAALVPSADPKKAFDTNASTLMKRALVTGAAGLIGSHVVDLLVREGWQVRALDNLEPQTHRRGKPAWISPKAEFVQGDMRNREAITAAVDGIDVVFHQAAYGGYMPAIAKFVRWNALGTAQMLEVIREKSLAIKKIVVASSQAVYSEGAGECPKHGPVFPGVRPIEQLRRGDWQVHCPICGAITKSVPTPENAPVGGETRSEEHTSELQSL